MKAIKTTSVSALFAGLLVLSLTCNAYADDAGLRDNPGYAATSATVKQHRSYGARVGAKALRGLANVGGAVIELPKNVANATNAPGSNFIWGLSGGAIKGVANLIGRMGVGIFDVLTAPIPTEPFVTPEMPWELFDQDTSYGRIFVYDDGNSGQ